jgi:hypothetical protein
MERQVMARYAVYYTADGRIERIVNCSASTALIQPLEAGQQIVSVPQGVTDATHTIVAGQAVPKGPS